MWCWFVILKVVEQESAWLACEADEAILDARITMPLRTSILPHLQVCSSAARNESVLTALLAAEVNRSRVNEDGIGMRVGIGLS